jgi:hypothetical protein
VNQRAPVAQPEPGEYAVDDVLHRALRVTQPHGYLRGAQSLCQQPENGELTGFQSDRGGLVGLQDVLLDQAQLADQPAEGDSGRLQASVAGFGDGAQHPLEIGLAPGNHADQTAGDRAQHPVFAHPVADQHQAQVLVHAGVRYPFHEPEGGVGDRLDEDEDDLGLGLPLGGQNPDFGPGAQKRRGALTGDGVLRDDRDRDRAAGRGLDRCGPARDRGM